MIRFVSECFSLRKLRASTWSPRTTCNEFGGMSLGPKPRRPLFALPNPELERSGDSVNIIADPFVNSVAAPRGSYIFLLTPHPVLVFEMKIDVGRLGGRSLLERLGVDISHGTTKDATSVSLKLARRQPIPSAWPKHYCLGLQCWR